MNKKKNKGGRPTDYSDEVANTICRRLIEGESLNKICFDDDMPCKATVYNWLADKELSEFLDKYICARERQAETFIDQCVDIADSTDKDKITLTNKDGREYVKIDHDHINRSRLRVDTRIKLAEKLAPKKYKHVEGREHTGKGGEPLVPLPEQLSKEDIVRIYQDAIRDKK